MNNTIARYVLLLVMLVLFAAIQNRNESSAPPSPAAKISTAQPWSPEQYRDFARRVVEACDRLPVGHRDRPSEVICGAPR